MGRGDYSKSHPTGEKPNKGTIFKEELFLLRSAKQVKNDRA